MAKQKKEQGNTPPGSPYLAAQRVWNERYGDAIQSARQWRFAALGLGVCLLVSIGGNVHQSAQSSVAPYAVHMNSHDEVVKVARADVLRTPTTNEVRAALRQWIIGARTIYSDPVALRAVIDQTYAMTASSSPAYKSLAKFNTDNNPFQASTQKQVSVHVRAIVPVSADTWHIEWAENTQLASGETTQSHWQASVTIQLTPPTTAAAVMVNPLGVYVTNYSWTQRLAG